MEKINIYVPKKVERTLQNDAEMFEVLKKDGKSINKNRFLTMLIKGYYEDYKVEANNTYDSILTNIDSDKLSSEEKEKIARAILRTVLLPVEPSRKGKNSARLSLKPTMEIEFLIEQIIDDLGADDSISRYFCRMLMSYCKKPFSEREQIIFKEKYDKLKRCCCDKKSIAFKTIWNAEVIHEVIPYKVVIGPEEMYNYLLCAEYNPYSGQQEAKTYRLNRIDKINYGKSIRSIDSSVQHYLEMMVEYGPQYMINDEEETCVRLNESGLKSFNRIYYGRPRVERIENKEGYSYLYFKCSKDQIYLYFRRFSGTEALFISPEWLRNKMIRFHQESVEVYE